WRVGVSTSFDEFGFPWASISASYAHGDTPDFGPIASVDQEEFNVTLDIKPGDGPFEGVWVRFRQAWNEGLRGVDHDNFRIIVNYSHDF
ncbi:MAG: hypothetical protein AAF491_09070, partial [Verrucomicrobiota bacterium]